MRTWLVSGCVAVGLSLPVSSPAQGSKPFIQAELLKNIKAKKAKAGDPVKARAVNSAILPGGIRISEGTVLLGEIRAADANALSISFDQAELDGKKTPVKFSIRAAMMPGAPGMRKNAGNSPPEVSSRRGRSLPGGPFDKENPDAKTGTPHAEPISGADAQPGRNVAAQTGSVIGLPGVTLQIDDSSQHASKFELNGGELQLKSGLQLMLAVVE